MLTTDSPPSPSHTCRTYHCISMTRDVERQRTTCAELYAADKAVAVVQSMIDVCSRADVGHADTAAGADRRHEMMVGNMATWYSIKSSCTLWVILVIQKP